MKLCVALDLGSKRECLQLASELAGLSDKIWLKVEDTYKKLSKLSVEKLLEKRMDKYTSYGVYK